MPRAYSGSGERKGAAHRQSSNGVCGSPPSSYARAQPNKKPGGLFTVRLALILFLHLEDDSITDY